jgi:hypothetical protein
MTAARGVRTFLSEPHAGDAYAVCARGAQNSVAACSKALTLGLPADVRFGVEQQCAEIESDCSELSRLRYGASVSPLPAARRMITPDGVDSPSYTAAEDERALEDWTEDGGAGEGGPTNARMPLTSPGGCAVPRSPA